MALLEKMGLIYQPYNSAGRLPTSAGMRVFVDYLINHLSTNLLSDSFPKDVEYDSLLQGIDTAFKTDNVEEVLRLGLLKHVKKCR